MWLQDLNKRAGCSTEARQWFGQTNHVAIENVVHEFPTRKTRSINKELEGELKTGIHLPPPRLAFTLLPAPL
jgi:hypothetical protein